MTPPPPRYPESRYAAPCDDGASNKNPWGWSVRAVSCNPHHSGCLTSGGVRTPTQWPGDHRHLTQRPRGLQVRRDPGLCSENVSSLCHVLRTHLLSRPRVKCHLTYAAGHSNLRSVSRELVSQSVSRWSVYNCPVRPSVAQLKTPWCHPSLLTLLPKRPSTAVATQPPSHHCGLSLSHSSCE